MSYDPQEGTSPYLGMDRTVRYDAAGFGEEPFDDASYEATASYEGGFLDDAVATDAQASHTAPLSGEMPTTVRRAPVSQTSGRPPRTLHRSGATAPVPSPPQQAYQYDDAYARGPRKAGPLNLLAAFLLSLVALVLRLGGVVCSAIVVACAVLTGSSRATLIQALNLTTDMLPPAMLGRLVYETPFGGVLRGDIIIAALVLFVADWLCLRYASRLRHPEEG